MRSDPRGTNPRVILAWTVPLAFTGIVIGKTVNDEAALEATVAGGLVAILASIATGVFYKNENDDEDGHEREEAEKLEQVFAEEAGSNPFPQLGDV